jgi:hypothetical protein
MAALGADTWRRRSHRPIDRTDSKSLYNMKTFAVKYLPGISMLGLWFASLLWLVSRIISTL